MKTAASDSRPRRVALPAALFAGPHDRGTYNDRVIRKSGALAGCCYLGGFLPFAITVADLDLIHAELDGRGLDLSATRIDTWNGKQYRVFFLREARNGYCYCFHQLLATA